MASQLAVYTAEYISYTSSTGNPIPTILLVGRDPETKKKRVYRASYDPYFYILQSKYESLAKEVWGKEIKNIEPIMLRDVWKRPLVKITTWDCRDIKPVKTFLEKQEVFTYEADLSQSLRFPLRYLIDQGIKSGVEISKGGLKPIDLVCPLRIWLVDVETYSKFQSSVNPWRDEPVILITIWDSYEDKLYTLYQYTDKEFQPLYKKHKLVNFPSEAQMLEYMLTLLEAKDPDLLAGWNFMRYDFTKLVERMKKYKIDYKRFSMFNSVDMRSFPYLVKGRVVFDLLLAFKQFTLAELRSYNLAYIAKEELKIKDHEAIQGPTSEMWDQEPEKLYKKNVEDVLITKQLDEKYKLIDFYDNMRREFGCLFHEVQTTSKVVDTALLRLVRGKIALPTARSRKAGDRYKGAVILEPKPGIYNNILCLDLSREYPRITRAYNIGPETYREDKGYYKILTEGDETVLSFARTPKSLLACLINHFFKLRDQAQDKMALFADNKEEYEKWKRRDDIYKGRLNAIYGIMGYPNFRLYMLPCARAVPLAGRQAIKRICKTAESLGFTVIYGDTDSVFIQLQEQTLKKQYGEAQYLVTTLNADLELYAKEQKLDENPFILATKRIYSDFIILSKKRYGGRYVWDEKRGYKVDWEEKGLELVRSDCSELEEEVQTQLLRFILLKTEPDKILQYWSEVEKKLKEKAYSPMEIAYPTQIVRKLGSYIKLKGAKKSGIPAHVSAVLYSNQYLNSDFTRGDKPRRLPIDPAKLKKYPRKYTVKEGELRELTGVAIDEYFKIPEEIISAIDWGKVYTRLFNKVQKLLALIGIELAKSDAFKKVKKKRVEKDKQSSIQKQKSILEYFGGS